MLTRIDLEVGFGKFVCGLKLQVFVLGTTSDFIILQTIPFSAHSRMVRCCSLRFRICIGFHARKIRCLETWDSQGFLVILPFHLRSVGHVTEDSAVQSKALAFTIRCQRLQMNKRLPPFLDRFGGPRTFEKVLEFTCCRCFSQFQPVTIWKTIEELQNQKMAVATSFEDPTDMSKVYPSPIYKTSERKARTCHFEQTRRCLRTFYLLPTDTIGQHR